MFTEKRRKLVLLIMTQFLGTVFSGSNFVFESYESWLNKIRTYDLHPKCTMCLTFKGVLPFKRQVQSCSDVSCGFGATCVDRKRVHLSNLSVRPVIKEEAEGFDCQCIFECQHEKDELFCASNFKFYPSLCHLKLESCRSKQDLSLRPVQLCKGLTVCLRNQAAFRLGLRKRNFPERKTFSFFSFCSF